MVELIASDGGFTKLPLEIAIQSPILKNLLTNPEFSEYHTKSVQLPTICTSTLQQVIEYLYHRKRTEQDGAAGNAEFTIDPKDAVDLLQAADFLDI